jgi:hypothetical protein
MTYSFIFSQIFGLIGLVFAILRFTQKERKKLLLFAVPAGVNNILSMFLNHQYQGLSVGIASIISPVIQSFIHENNQKTKIIRLIIGFGFGFIGFILYRPTNSIITWLPILGYTNSRFAETLEDVQKMRKFWLISQCLWGIYQIFSKNWIMVLGEFIIIYINLKNLGFRFPSKKEIIN